MCAEKIGAGEVVTTPKHSSSAVKSICFGSVSNARGTNQADVRRADAAFYNVFHV
jgi:hypothetical protein